MDSIKACPTLEMLARWTVKNSDGTVSMIGAKVGSLSEVEKKNREKVLERSNEITEKALILRSWEMTSDQIATHLGVPVKTVRHHLQKTDKDHTQNLTMRKVLDQACTIQTLTSEKTVLTEKLVTTQALITSLEKKVEELTTFDQQAWIAEQEEKTKQNHNTLVKQAKTKIAEIKNERDTQITQARNLTTQTREQVTKLHNDLTQTRQAYENLGHQLTETKNQLTTEQEKTTHTKNQLQAMTLFIEIYIGLVITFHILTALLPTSRFPPFVSNFLSLHFIQTILTWIVF